MCRPSPIEHFAGWAHDLPPLVIEHAESFWVQDADPQTGGWWYFRHNEETTRQAKVLTQNEARRMAVNFARC
jgi:hypothetical protein